jgi:tetratricopeptide (TPR) repeat protein
VKEPRTASEILAAHEVRQSDPARYIELATQWIGDDPTEPSNYFGRHQAWLMLNQPEKAIEDLSMAIALEPKPIDFWCRGDVYRRLGHYRLAREDLARGEAMDPAKWDADAWPLLSQADVHARLGDEASALACCARLPDHFWAPGIRGLPPGDKSQIAAELIRRAATAR